jgi:hypothetical protein
VYFVGFAPTYLAILAIIVPVFDAKIMATCAIFFELIAKVFA